MSSYASMDKASTGGANEKSIVGATSTGGVGGSTRGSRNYKYHISIEFTKFLATLIIMFGVMPSSAFDAT
jgi:hypothetical protein